MVTTIWWSFFHIFPIESAIWGWRNQAKQLVPRREPRDLFSATTPRQRLPATIAASPPLADLLHELGHVLVRAVPSAELKKSEKVLIYKIWRSCLVESCRFGSFDLHPSKLPQKEHSKHASGSSKLLGTCWRMAASLVNGSMPQPKTGIKILDRGFSHFLEPLHWESLQVVASHVENRFIGTKIDFSLAFDSVVPSFAITLLQHAGLPTSAACYWGCGNINLSF